MNIGIIGTGMVAKHIGSALVALGHSIKLGSRTADHEGAAAWAQEAGDNASHGTFADAAAFGEVVMNAVAGLHTLAALDAAQPQNLAGKVLMDISNPLDFSQGFPPSLSVANTDSLGEQIQRQLPQSHVVKVFNTVAHPLMTNPTALAGGDHTLLICGNDDGAKAQVTGWMREWFGWKDILDVGDITCARGTEAWLLLWTRLYGKFQSPMFSLKIVRAEGQS